ncbi:hypothetical protein BDQ17DRAFT_1236389 [Cyathus striatus]|nr:hypothetical protein BDQ17DRAFT_1236389 [Cyathus striatus]
MDSPDLHEVLFQWPHTEPYNVIVTGTFDQWSRSILLSKTPTGFEATIKIPYGDKIKYKFIVDGQWVFRDDLPTDVDPGGFINNVYTAPHKSISSPLSLPPAAVLQSPFNTPQDASVAGHHTSPKPLDPLNPMQPVTTTSEANADSTSSSGTADTTENSNHKMENGVIISEQKAKVPSPPATFPQLISDIATTIAAADGTSSAFSYVASGIGAAVHGVIGVDPVNPEQVWLVLVYCRQRLMLFLAIDRYSNPDRS